MNASLAPLPLEAKPAPCAESLTRANESLQARERLLTATARASRLLLQAPDVRGAIPSVLGLIGEAAQVDRVSLLETRIGPNGENLLAVVSEWTADGVAPHAREVVVNPCDERRFAFVCAELRAGRSVCFSKTDGAVCGIEGVGTQSKAMVPIFEKAFEPLLSLDPDMKFQIRKVGGLPQGIGSDHDSYLAAGVPGFFWLQAGRAKYNYGHHTQHDTFDLAIPEYQRHTSMVVAIAALRLADLPDLLPRENLTARSAKRRMLGVQLDAEMEIQEVVKDAPAEKAGIKPGDRLVKFNGVQVGDTIMLGQAIQGAPKESKVTLRRDGKEIEVPVTFPD